MALVVGAAASLRAGRRPRAPGARHGSRRHRRDGGSPGARRRRAIWPAPPPTGSPPGCTTPRSRLAAVALTADLLSARSARAAADGTGGRSRGKPGAPGAQGGPGADRRRSDPADRVPGRRAVGRRGRADGGPARAPTATRAWSPSSRTPERPPPRWCTIQLHSATRRSRASVEAAVRLALANVRLQVDIAARVSEVAASRRRLVEAGDEQRRHLREELRSGAERGLDEVSSDLAALARTAGERRPRCSSRSWRSWKARATDLARFAQGVHPRALTEGGLPSALRGARRPGERPGRPPGAAGALPGAAGGGRVLRVLGGSGQRGQVRRGVARRIDVDAAGVEDRGARAGRRPRRADPARGSGLRGLEDRVAALGGGLSIESPPGGGTRLTAELPTGAGAAR